MTVGNLWKVEKILEVLLRKSWSVKILAPLLCLRGLNYDGSGKTCYSLPASTSVLPS